MQVQLEITAETNGRGHVSTIIEDILPNILDLWLR